jgi:hypothetical protein
MIRRLFWLVVLVGGMSAAYWYRPELRSFASTAKDRWAVLRRTPADTTAKAEEQSSVNAETAAAAMVKLDRLRDGRSRSTSLTTDEVQSLLVFEYRQLLPAYVDSPRVSLEGDHLRLRVRLPVERLPGIRSIGEIAALLPDTADLDVRGTLLPAADGHIAFAVDGVSAQRIPLPRRLVPSALEALGRVDRPDLPADAIDLALPKGVRAAYVRGDSLVLLGTAR